LSYACFDMLLFIICTRLISSAVENEVPHSIILMICKYM